MDGPRPPLSSNRDGRWPEGNRDRAGVRRDYPPV